MSRKLIGLLALAVVTTLSVAAYAFTASNTVVSSWAGSGSAAINGWNTTGVTNIDYTFDATDPTKFASVSFDMNDHPASDVKVQLDSAGGTWYDCGPSGAVAPYSVTCNIAGESVQSANQLTVVSKG